MKPQIINIINFIRAAEPREDVDLLTPVKNQIELLNKYDLPGTFLLQYDALINPNFTDLLKEADEKCEIGAWFEIVQPLAEDAGLTWRGRPGFSWDWHADVGFSVGYTKDEREKLTDVYMKKFKEIYGCYPKSVGSWAIDAHTLLYMSDKYGIISSCNCKDQWGTDGYTIWGGYYGQGYYPSRKNMYTPAQNKENQIPVPVFRMLGSDPIYQYDIGLNLDDGSPVRQSVVSLEPVYTGKTGGGGVPGWVNWFFKENFSGRCLSFGYAQAGQENSFGWEDMKDGLIYQTGLIAKKTENGELSVMTLGDTGRWYKQTYDTTPVSSIAALSDWKNEGHKSVWYCSRYYRVNIYMENNRLWIRDLYKFDENYRERYTDEVCKTEYLVFDNLPVIDGNRWSGGGIRAGAYPFVNIGGKHIAPEFIGFEYSEDKNSIKLKCLSEYKDMTIICGEKEITVTQNGAGFSFDILSDPKASLPGVKLYNDKAELTYNGFKYDIQVRHGVFSENNGIPRISSVGGKLAVSLY